MKAFWQRPFHPFLFALYPIIALVALNIDQANLFESIRPLFITIIVTILLQFLFRQLTKDNLRGALILTWILFLTLSLYHVFNLINTTFSLAFDIFMAVYTTIIILGAWFIWRKANWNLTTITSTLNTIGFITIIWPIGTIIISMWQTPTVNARPSTPLAPSAIINQQAPDIYYLILDGYGRNDALKSIYQYDNTSFLTSLEERGFYVAEQSASNYAQTYLSLASSLNLNYVDDLMQINEENSNRMPLGILISDNQVIQFLYDRGYTIAVHDSGHPYIGVKHDEHTPNSAFTNTRWFNTLLGPINYFEYALIDMTGLTLFLQIYLVNNENLGYSDHDNRDYAYHNKTFAEHRELILANFKSIEESVQIPSPKLVVTHIMSPHPPFIFDQDGNFIQLSDQFGLQDGSYYSGSTDEYITGYRDQIQYINTLVLSAIDEIKANSTNDLVIIIQGDHGPGSHLDWESIEDSCFQERHGILNAYYIPRADTANLYPTITPVNTFRLVFDTYFGTNLGLLDDQSYFSTWQRPYQFIDVTDQLETGCQE